MMVHCHFVPVIVFKQLKPHWISWPEAIMENKVSLRCVLLYKLTNFTIKVCQQTNIIGLLWLINRFESYKGRMLTKSLKQCLHLLDTPLNICIVYLAILPCYWIKLA